MVNLNAILLDVFDTRSRQNDPDGFEKKVTILAFKAHKEGSQRGHVVVPGALGRRRADSRRLGLANSD